MKRRIAISAGHSNVKGKDRGAAANGYIEGDFTVDLRNLIKDILNQRGITVNTDPDDSVTFQTVALFKKYFNTGNDICIDIHFNAGGGTGTEVIIPDKHTPFERELGERLARVIASTIGITNRGVKLEKHTARKKLLWMSIPAETILIEVCFIDNAKDMSLYLRNKLSVAVFIADILELYIK